MTSGVAVFDASPLIVFHQIGQLEILRWVFAHAIVPTVVAREVAPSLGELPGWIAVHHDFPIPSSSRKIDDGERAAIALAMRLSADFVVLDDLAGRRAAVGVGLTAIGSLGLLVRAKRSGLIREVRPEMDAMIFSGLFASEALYRQILSIAGEDE